MHSKLCGTTILRMRSKFEWCQGEIKDARNLYDQVCRLISWKVYVAFLKLIHYDTYSLSVVPIYSDFKYRIQEVPMFMKLRTTGDVDSLINIMN